MIQNEKAAGHFLAALTILIWGTTFISTKVLLRAFMPVEILFFRFVIGYVVLMIAHPHRLKTTDMRQESMMAAAGLCGITLYYLLENIALTYTTVSNVGVIVSIAPFFTALLSHRFLNGEKPGAQFYVGFAAAITGVVLISFNGSAVMGLNPLGDFLAVLAAMVWAVYTILTKKISAFGHSTVQTTRRIFFYGVLFMIPAQFALGFRLGIERFMQPVNLLNILFLGICASALCFVTWNTAVKLLGAVKTSAYIYLVPVITVIAAIIFLQETSTRMTELGAVLTLAGLLLSAGKSSHRKRSEASWTHKTPNA